MLLHERLLWRRRLCVAGIDEAGRGCLAGPVVAAAVVLPPDADLPGVTDSKLLTDRERRELLPRILRAALGVGVGVRSARRIDRTNILAETKQAMLAAVAHLPVRPDFLLIDGNQRLPTVLEQRTIVKGDRLSLSIAAASIVAKVTRDDIMLRLHERFDVYHWRENKGYGTPEHLAALRRHGPCCLHRQTFHGVGNGEP
ncbi:MAG: ribonuclease HII [Myxococcales bacterium]|nr:ribonuclease HII [Myxococcales bacterium]